MHQNFTSLEEEEINYEFLGRKFECLEHPQVLLDIVEVNENLRSVKPICIKCLIDDDRHRIKGVQLMPLEKFISVYGKPTKVSNSLPNLKVREKILSFWNKDYLETYKQNVGSQFESFEKEAKEVMDLLSRLKNKYHEYYLDNLITLKNNTQKIKQKIEGLVGTNNEKGQLQFNTNDPLRSINKIKTFDDFSAFLNNLLRKSNEIPSSEYSTIVDLIDEGKNKSENDISIQAEINKFRGMFTKFY